MCRNIDALCMEEEINEKGDEIGEIPEKICLVKKDEMFCDINDKRMKSM